jgi:hypothetical protein
MRKEDIGDRKERTHLGLCEGPSLHRKEEHVDQRAAEQQHHQQCRQDAAEAALVEAGEGEGAGVEVVEDVGAGVDVFFVISGYLIGWILATRR